MDKDFFLKTVLESFSFLNIDYDFTFTETRDTNRNFSIFYEKVELLIELKYNKPNKYFEVSIFNKTNATEEIYHNSDWSIGLTWLVIKYEPVKNKEINNLQFDNLEAVINYKATLLKKYGNSILSCREWFSWGDITT